MTAPMRFQHFGKSLHLRIERAEHLRHVLQLDESHWVATGADIRTINTDRVFLDLLDTDDNGRVMCYEIMEGIRWLFAVLSDTRAIDRRSTTLELDTINAGHDDGRAIRTAARKMLNRLGRSDSGSITLEQVRSIKAQVEAQSVSELGVALPEAPERDDVKQFMLDAITSVGGTPHPSGKPGLGQDKLDEFLSALKAYRDWYLQGQLPEDGSPTDIMPLGTDTPVAYAAMQSVRQKLDQYFAQCEAAALDERFTARMGWTDAELANLDFDDPAVIAEVLEKAPLAPPRADRTLALDEPVNPAWVEPLKLFRESVVNRLHEPAPAQLSAKQWLDIKACFAAHEAWLAARPDARVEPLGVDTWTTYLQGDYRGAVERLIAESAKTAFDLGNIRLTEQLILYQARMIDLVNNFVSFPHLYSKSSRAMFEMGTLIMDGRHFSLAVRVDDRKEHMSVAKTSYIYVLYVTITPRDRNEKPYEVAVPVTSGGRGNLCVGKRGIFKDIAGNECDARVVQILENPIGVREAFAAPFKRIGTLMWKKIESLTAQAEKELDATTTQTFDATAGGQPQAAKQQQSNTGSLLLGGGMAVAGLGASFAYITKTLSGLAWWKILLGLGGAVMAVIIPTCIIAFLKLKRRDLSSIIEGSGWAVNARMRLSFRLGRFFTRHMPYPKGSRGTWRIPWGWIIFLVLLAGALWGAREYQQYARRKRKATEAKQPAPAPPSEDKKDASPPPG